jgi:K+-transporting ATPase ATPase C chain
MRQVLRASFVFVGLCTLLFGVLYPALVTGVSQLVFPAEANGSLLVDGDVLRGSRLLGQPFTDPRHLWSRPSATGPVPYNGAASSGSNLGPSNPALRDAVRDRVATLRATGLGAHGSVPVDLVTTSGSGLDPHISVAAAELQVERIAAARGLGADRVRQVIGRHTEGRLLGVFGEPRVNVLAVNLELDGGAGAPDR